MTSTYSNRDHEIIHRQMTPSHKLHENRFNATSVLYITPHNSLHRYIRVYYIQRSTESDLRLSIDDILQDSIKISKTINKKDIPVLTIRQGGVFWGNGKVYIGDFVTKEESKNEVIAEWKPCRIIHGINVFTFIPPNDNDKVKGKDTMKTDFVRQNRHPITLKRTTIISSRSESFVKDSVTYIWRFDKKINDFCMTLYSQRGGIEEIVAKARRPWYFDNTGGCITLDESKIDTLTVVLTTIAMWRKLRLRTNR